MRRTLFIAVLALLLGTAATAQSGESDVRTIALRVDDHYNALTTLQAAFVERYSGAGMHREESGTLLLKRPGRMLWEYRQPKEKVFLVNGKTAWFYVSGERQAQRYNARSIDDLRTPLAYLLGRTKLQKVFDGLSLAPDKRPVVAGNLILRGVPRNMQERVSEVLLEITPGSEISRLVIEEFDGSTTEFQLNAQRMNVSIPDSRFRFNVPSGVEVVEAQQAFAQ